MRGYRKFSLWISIPLSKIFVSLSHKSRKNTTVSERTILKNSQEEKT